MLNFIRKKLKNLLKNCRKVAILAIGNPLRRDDAVGIFIGERLKENENMFFDVFISYQSPEAFLFKIIDGPYSHVIILDGIDAKLPPGEILILTGKEITGREPLTTHTLPIKMLVDLIEKNGKRTIIVGVQIKDRSLKTGLTKAVKESAEKIITSLLEILSQKEKF